jgi:hypothetical protein
VQSHDISRALARYIDTSLSWSFQISKGSELWAKSTRRIDCLSRLYAKKLAGLDRQTSTCKVKRLFSLLKLQGSGRQGEGDWSPPPAGPTQLLGPASVQWLIFTCDLGYSCWSPASCVNNCSTDSSSEYFAAGPKQTIILYQGVSSCLPSHHRLQRRGCYLKVPKTWQIVSDSTAKAIGQTPGGRVDSDRTIILGS